MARNVKLSPPRTMSDQAVDTLLKLAFLEGYCIGRGTDIDDGRSRAAAWRAWHRNEPEPTP